jgi:hypothetical protein
MKKWMVGFLLIGISAAAFSQNNFATSLFIVSECTRVLGQSVPYDYSRLDRTTFERRTDNVRFWLYVDGGIVRVSSCVIEFSTTNEARQWTSQYYDSLEANNWQFVRENSDGDIYRKNSVYALIMKLQRNSNGFIGSAIMFTNNVEYFGY